MDEAFVFVWRICRIIKKKNVFNKDIVGRPSDSSRLDVFRLFLYVVPTLIIL